MRSLVTGFKLEGRTTIRSAVKQASTIGSPYDPAVEVAMIRNTVSFAMSAVIRSFTAGLLGH
jgi:hypothetical protein